MNQFLEDPLAFKRFLDDEPVLEKFLSGGPLVRIHGQALFDEVVEGFAPLGLVGESCGRVVFDDEHGANWVQVGVRGLALSHLDSGYPQGPYIRLLIVLALGNHLGRHPKRSPDHCVLIGMRVFQLGRDSEVSELAHTVVVDENVAGFYIPVDLSVVVQVDQSF